MILIETTDKNKLKQLAKFASDNGLPFTIGSGFGLALCEDVYCAMDNLEDNVDVRTPEINEKLSAMTKTEYNDFIVHLAESAADTGYGERISEEMYDNIKDFLIENLEREMQEFIDNRGDEESRTSALAEEDKYLWLVYFKEEIVYADLYTEIAYNEDGTLNYDECASTDGICLNGIDGAYYGTKNEVIELVSKREGIPSQHLGAVKLHHLERAFGN